MTNVKYVKNYCCCNTALGKYIRAYSALCNLIFSLRPSVRLFNSLFPTMIILSPVVLPARYFLRPLPEQTRIKLLTLITYVLTSAVEFYVLTLKFGSFYFLRRGRKPHVSSTLNVTPVRSNL